MSERILQFYPQQSQVDPPAWSVLGQLKLDTLRLGTGPVFFQASATCAAFHRGTGTPAPVCMTSQNVQAASTDSFVLAGCDSIPGSAVPHVPVPCSLWMLNTVDDLDAYDKAALLKQAGQAVWDAVTSGAAYDQPHLLTPCVALVHADLKKYNFTHCVAFPALKTPAPYHVTFCAGLSDALSPPVAANICASVMGSAVPLPCIVKWGEGGVQVEPLASVRDWPATDPGGVWPADTALAVVDSSPVAGVMGWTARNALLLLTAAFPGVVARVLCLQLAGGRVDAARSRLMELRLPRVPQAWASPGAPCPDVVGWEAGPGGPGGLQVASLGESLDPVRQAADAVQLNLKLMKWRASPLLDIEAVASLKCLILGAGTLGCEVARTLLAWGVSSLCLVDNGRVAFSNPVRQSLYQFEDCVSAPGGAPKAEAAAAALRRISPTVHAEAACLSIAMPGHPPPPEEAARAQEECAQLERLILSHDVVFLMTDTRESRWLPTVLAAAHNKIVVNAALGFDGWVVMRHGCALDVPCQERLGCYFCNDVVAPLNSTIGRSLDEQCTVARPGLARITGAVAVEMLAALMQHPERIAVGAETNADVVFGGVPHMLRGALNGFTQTTMKGTAHSMCTACSSIVVQEYRERGWEFVAEVLRNPKRLEELTGLKQVHEKFMLDAVDRAELGHDAGEDGEGDDWLEL